LSLFNGMNTGRQALENCGFKINNYFSSEIKPYAIELTQHHFSDTIQVGDVTKWREWDIDWKSIDLVLSGSPCQDLSAAGKRAGINGKKSSLFFVFIEILEHIKSLNSNVIFFQENVGSANVKDVGIMSRVLGVYPIRINSSLVTAQLRDRYYWTNINFDKNIVDKNIILSDIITNGYTNRLKSRALLESDSRPLSSAIKMFHRFHAKGFQTLVFKSKHHYDECVLHYNNNFKGKSAKEIFYEGNPYDGVRFLNQMEMESLQTVPIGYTKCVSRNDAACLLGDGWTIDVIAHIFKGLR